MEEKIETKDILLKNPINGQKKNTTAHDRSQVNEYNANIQPSVNNNSNIILHNPSQLRNRSNNEFVEGSNDYVPTPVEWLIIHKPDPEPDDLRNE